MILSLFGPGVGVCCAFIGVWINNSSHERTLVIKPSMPWGLQPKPETRLRAVWPSRQLAGSLTRVCFQPPSHRGDGPADDTGSSVTTEPDLIFKSVPIRAQKAITPDVMSQTGLDSSDAWNFLKMIPTEVSLARQSTPHRWEKNPILYSFYLLHYSKVQVETDTQPRVMSQRALIPNSLKAKMFILPSSYWSNPPYPVIS